MTIKSTFTCLRSDNSSTTSTPRRLQTILLHTPFASKRALEVLTWPHAKHPLCLRCRYKRSLTDTRGNRHRPTSSTFHKRLRPMPAIKVDNLCLQAKTSLSKHLCFPQYSQVRSERNSWILDYQEKMASWSRQHLSEMVLQVLKS
jgi:hypothetical protein